jgi:hypothetical protein
MLSLTVMLVVSGNTIDDDDDDDGKGLVTLILKVNIFLLDNYIF